jgi:hypothetical protein
VGNAAGTLLGLVSKSFEEPENWEIGVGAMLLSMLGE